MITYLSSNDGYYQHETWRENCWISVEMPTNDEINFLINEFNVPVEFLNDISDFEERPRVESKNEWSLVLIRAPFKVAEDNDFMRTVPFGILISDRYIITICHYQTEFLSDFILYTRKKKLNITKKIELTFRLFVSSSVWYLKYLSIISKKINEIENHIGKSVKNKDLQILMKIDHSLVYFLMALKGNENVLNRIKNQKIYKDDIPDPALEQTAAVELNQALEVTSIYTNIISRLSGSISSMISNNLNFIMEKLTSISIVLMIPTLIASFYGMNVPNFIEQNSYAFVSLIVGSSILTFWVYYFFKRKKWL